MSSNSPQQDPEARNISWTSPEILGELVLLAFTAGLMIVFLLELPDLSGRRAPARWLPILALSLGAPFLVLRLITVFRRKKAMEQGMIMDLGFRSGGDPAGERRRAVLYFVTLFGLFIWVWLIGFHIGLPTWVMGYLAWWARSRWIIYVPVGIAFEALMVGIQDLILDITWPQPLLFRLFDADYFINDWFSRVF